MAITLESLLFEEQTSYVDMTPEEAAMECADVFAELSDIEMTLTTYEAATIIKKAQSGSKKVKVEKKVMKAKDAKATKAGGKVVKMKKVGTESDTELDGGTGPLPTTTDTNGLTDTDLDVDPNADIEVTSVADDQPAQEEIVGTEGVDFIVEYEDAKILEFEDESQKWYQKMGESLKKFWDAIVNFVKSVADKIVNVFASDKKFYDLNKEAIAKGLASDTTVTVNAYICKDIQGFWKEVNENSRNILGVKVEEFGDNAELNTFLGRELPKDTEEFKLSALKQKNVEMTFETVSKDGSKMFSTLNSITRKRASEAVAIAKKTKDKEVISKIKKSSASYQKASSKFYREFVLLRGTVSKIMHAAAKAGGAKVAEEPAK